ASHYIVELFDPRIGGNYANVVLIDNEANSDPSSVLRGIRDITGREPVYHKVDLLDRPALERVFQTYTIECVIHFAGLKSVKESIADPLAYYQNNVVGTLTLIDVMRKAGVKRLMFSSSATIYGDQAYPVN